jgi:hypothetical protein
MKKNKLQKEQSEEQFKVIKKLRPLFKEQAFVIHGGTGIYHYLPFRLSQDVDFFIQTDFDPLKLQTKLEEIGLHTKPITIDKGTLEVLADGVRLQFLHYPYPFYKTPETVNDIKYASLLDIAATKISALAMRSEKKDFIDLYMILQQHSFEEVMFAVAARYNNKINTLTIGQALVYFDEADKSPEPSFLQEKKVSWNTIKTYFTRHVREFVQVAEKVLNKISVEHTETDFPKYNLD